MSVSPAAFLDETLTVRGVRTHLLSGGEGEPVLYLHGGGTTATWLPFHARLARECRLLAPDLLGFGGTDRPEWLDEVSDFAVHYLDLLDQLGLERVHLVGLSLGGWIAAELASWASHRLKSLVLIDPCGVSLPEHEPPDVFLLDFEGTVRLLHEDEELIEAILSRPLPPEKQAERLKGQVTFARVAWNPYLYSPKLMQRLHRVQAPTLVLWGERDRLLSPVLGEAWRRAIAGSELRLVGRCGHNPPVEQPEACARAVLDFVAARA